MRRNPNDVAAHHNPPAAADVDAPDQVPEQPGYMPIVDSLNDRHSTLAVIPAVGDVHPEAIRADRDAPGAVTDADGLGDGVGRGVDHRHRAAACVSDIAEGAVWADGHVDRITADGDGLVTLALVVSITDNVPPVPEPPISIAVT